MPSSIDIPVTSTRPLTDVQSSHRYSHGEDPWDVYNEDDDSYRSHRSGHSGSGSGHPLEEKSESLVRSIGKLVNKQVQADVHEFEDKVHENVIEPVDGVLNDNKKK